MAKFSGEALDWLSKLETTQQLRQENPKLSGLELADKLGGSKARASYISTLSDCLNQAAIDKIRQATLANPPFSLSFNSARALAGLTKAKTTDLPGLAHSALAIVLTRRLTTVQIEALVDWLVQGNSLETFKEPEAGKKGKTKADKKTKTQSQPTDKAEDLKPVIELSKKAEAEIARNDGQTTYQDELRALLQKGAAETEEDENSNKKGKSGKSPKKSSGTSTPSGSQKVQSDWLWEAMLGVKFMNQLRSKAKKGQLTNTEKLLIILYRASGPLGWVLKHIGKIFEEMFKGLWHSVKEAFGKTFKKILDVVLPLLIILALFWAAWKVLQFGVLYPLHWIESKVESAWHGLGTHTAEPVAPEAPSTGSMISTAPQPAGSSELESAKLKHKTSNSPLRTSHSTSAYQPSTSFITTASPINTTGPLYDPKLLELEIAALPQNCVVKDYPLAPDEGMPVDVAVSRMQDLIDPDKYTMMIGADKQIIQSVNAGTTTLMIYFKSADSLGGFLGGAKSPLNFLWEDVRYIHINEIDHFSKPGVQPDIKYQIALVVKGSKFPLTIQCGSADDLENLVSTMEYFIRHSRLAHDAQPGGLPYPHQGLVLNNDRVVEKLWAGSPAWNAVSYIETAQPNHVAQLGASQPVKVGVQLGEHLWSVGKATRDQQSKKDLEAGLQTPYSNGNNGPLAQPNLAPRLVGSAQVPVTIFVASPADWEKAFLISRQPGSNNAIDPKLRKLVLTNP